MNGTEIRKAREAKGWSQARLAREVGTGQSYISALESGKKVNVETSTLDRIATVLGFRLVITMEPQEKAAPPAA